MDLCQAGSSASKSCPSYLQHERSVHRHCSEPRKNHQSYAQWFRQGAPASIGSFRSQWINLRIEIHHTRSRRSKRATQKVHGSKAPVPTDAHEANHKCNVRARTFLLCLRLKCRQLDAAKSCTTLGKRDMWLANELAGGNSHLHLLDFYGKCR